MAYSIQLHPQNSAEELKDWLEQTRPSDPVSILSLCQNLLHDEGLVETHPSLRHAVAKVNEAHAQAVLAQRGESLSVLMSIETAGSGPVLSLDEKTQWPRAVHRTSCRRARPPTCRPRGWKKGAPRRPMSRPFTLSSTVSDAAILTILSGSGRSPRRRQSRLPRRHLKASSRLPEMFA